jgi:hypothetical protein
MVGTTMPDGIKLCADRGGHCAGLDVTRPILVVLDGATALRRAVLDVLDHPVIARCQLHKIRNVQDRLPEKLRQVVVARMRRATTPSPRWPRPN